MPNNPLNQLAVLFPQLWPWFGRGWPQTPRTPPFNPNVQTTPSPPPRDETGAPTDTSVPRELPIHRRLIEAYRRDPRAVPVLLSVAGALTGPRGFGESGVGQAVRALQTGYNTLALYNAMRDEAFARFREEQRKERELAMRERKTAAETEKTAAEAKSIPRRVSIDEGEARSKDEERKALAKYREAQLEQVDRHNRERMELEREKLKQAERLAEAGRLSDKELQSERLRNQVEVAKIQAAATVQAAKIRSAGSRAEIDNVLRRMEQARKNVTSAVGLEESVRMTTEDWERRLREEYDRLEGLESGKKMEERPKFGAPRPGGVVYKIGEAPWEKK